MTAPPAAESGKKYKTVDARCMACRIKGGPEGPCVDVRKYRKQFGTKCPRVDLDPANAEAADLLWYLADETVRPLAPAVYEALCSSMPAEERLLVMERARAALADSGVRSVLWPTRQDGE